MTARHTCRTYGASFTLGRYYARCSCGWTSRVGSLTDAEGACAGHVEATASHDSHRRCERCNGEGRGPDGTGCCHCRHTGVVWDGPRGVHVGDGNAMKPCPECVSAVAEKGATQ